MSAAIPDHAKLSIEELRRQLKAAAPKHQHLLFGGMCIVCGTPAGEIPGAPAY